MNIRTETIVSLKPMAIEDKIIVNSTNEETSPSPLGRFGITFSISFIVINKANIIDDLIINFVIFSP